MLADFLSYFGTMLAASIFLFRHSFYHNLRNIFPQASGYFIDLRENIVSAYC